ncbi:MAG: hypothetical protein JXR31_07955 [Prolixibacteraceae bacterium]|nr:hypothetical protein [Prolixibacteraceae bacterium]MBN2774167.1 hypothetical protein [Prolixibacteraceae bacterium]
MKRILYILIVSVFILFSCEKEEGEGGTSTISGQVLVKNYNSDFSVKLGEYYAPEIDVYIIYGDDEIYSDRFKTGIDGWYRFQYLTKGKYTVYALSADSTRQSPSGVVVVKKEVEVTKNNQSVVVDDLVIFD